MSEHHRTPEWMRVTRRVRPLIKATLPAPCVDCQRPVYPADNWHVGHILAAAHGGTNDAWNLGPTHARCNTRAGGKIGASISNAKRKKKTETPNW